jgi:hypothetical protein
MAQDQRSSCKTTHSMALNGPVLAQSSRPVTSTHSPSTPCPCPAKGIMQRLPTAPLPCLLPAPCHGMGALIISIIMHSMDVLTAWLTSTAMSSTTAQPMGIMTKDSTPSSSPLRLWRSGWDPKPNTMGREGEASEREFGVPLRLKQPIPTMYLYPRIGFWGDSVLFFSGIFGKRFRIGVV